jgi:hypothetical protein
MGDREALEAFNIVGLQELRDLGLVTSKVAVTSEDGTYLTFQRRRNVHELNPGADSPAPPWRS